MKEKLKNILKKAHTTKEKIFDYIEIFLRFSIYTLIAASIPLAIYAYSNSEIELKEDGKKILDKKSEKKFYINNLKKACRENYEYCRADLWERVINIQHAGGSGTGFIIEGDRETLTILTASHVIRKGNGKDSYIHDTISIYDTLLENFEKPISACAFFQNGYADVGIIKIKNYTNTIFEKIETFDSASIGDKLIVIHNKDPEHKITMKYSINSFLKEKNLVELNEIAEHGMSGSPILKQDGSLLAILISGNAYYTYGTYKLFDIINHGIDYLVTKENHFAPYICKTF